MLLLSSIIAIVLLDLTTAQQCPVSNVFVPTDHQVEPSSSFNFAESGLQIFTQMRIPCDGFITQWRFIAKESLVLGLHLGVFAYRNNKGALGFELMAESYINSVATPNNKRGNWVYFPVEPPIPVRKDQFLGMFYDRLDTVADLLTIVSKNKFDITFPIPPTIVLLKDATDLVMNKTVDIRTAQREYRYPALTAVVRSFELPTVPTVPPPPPAEATTVVTTRRRRTVVPSTTTKAATTRRTTTKKPTTTTEEPTPSPYYGAQPVTLPAENAPYLPVTLPSGPGGRRSTTVPGRCLNPPTALQTCEKLVLRGFFDYDRGICRPFFGCESFSPDANNFGSVDDCKVLCEPYDVSGVPLGQGLTLPPPISQPNGIFQIGAECYQTPSASTFCTEASTRYYFDASRHTCYPFFGCALISTNGNNFATMNDCTSRCNATAGPLTLQTPKPTTAAPLFVPTPVGQSVPIFRGPVQPRATLDNQQQLPTRISSFDQAAAAPPLSGNNGFQQAQPQPFPVPVNDNANYNAPPQGNFYPQQQQQQQQPQFQVQQQQPQQLPPQQFQQMQPQQQMQQQPPQQYQMQQPQQQQYPQQQYPQQQQQQYPQQQQQQYPQQQQQQYPQQQYPQQQYPQQQYPQQQPYPQQPYAQQQQPQQMPPQQMPPQQFAQQQPYNSPNYPQQQQQQGPYNGAGPGNSYPQASYQPGPPVIGALTVNNNRNNNYVPRSYPVSNNNYYFPQNNQQPRADSLPNYFG